MMLFHDGLRIAMPKMPATAQIFRAPLLMPFLFLLFAPFQQRRLRRRRTGILPIPSKRVIRRV